MNKLKLKRESIHTPDSRLGVKADIAHIIVIEALQFLRQRPVRSLIGRGGQILCPVFERIKIETGTLILRGTIKRRAEKHKWNETVFIHVRSIFKAYLNARKKTEGR